MSAQTKIDNRAPVTFDEWWEESGKYLAIQHRKRVAGEAWNAAVEAATEHVVPGGDREAIKELKTIPYAF